MKSVAAANPTQMDEDLTAQVSAALKEIATLHKSNQRLDREIEKIHQSTLKRLGRIREHLAYVQANR